MHRDDMVCCVWRHPLNCSEIVHGDCLNLLHLSEEVQWIPKVDLDDFYDQGRTVQSCCQNVWIQILAWHYAVSYVVEFRHRNLSAVFFDVLRTSRDRLFHSQVQP